MKTFTKTLLTCGLGVFGTLGTAQAAVPYGYGSTAYGVDHGIAAGGCYVPTTSGGYGSSHAFPYRPGSYGRSAFREDRFHTPRYPSTRHDDSLDPWGDDCGYGTPGRLPSSPMSYRDRADDRYGRSSLFEPWRPANASHRLDRRNW